MLKSVMPMKIKVYDFQQLCLGLDDTLKGFDDKTKFEWYADLAELSRNTRGVAVKYKLLDQEPPNTNVEIDRIVRDKAIRKITGLRKTEREILIWL